MVIDKGLYIQAADVAIAAGYPDYSLPYYLVFQVFDENGEPAKGSYSGKGGVIKEDGKTYVYLGSPADTTNLQVFLISETPEPESEKRFNDMAEGFNAGMEGKRAKKNASHEWREGFAEAKKVRR